MTPQIEWIESASGDARRHRAMIVGWQNSIYAINQLVEKYNSITLTPEPKSDRHEPMRVIAARRQVLASVLELKNRLDEWLGYFNKSRFDCSSINAVRKTYRSALDQAECWRTIRNLTFHYGDVIEPPEDLLNTYYAIAHITDEEVNSVWQAMIEVGQIVKNVALNYT
jgi:hypothetical protein